MRTYQQWKKISSSTLKPLLSVYGFSPEKLLMRIQGFEGSGGQAKKDLIT
jgi:hypothetical protein